MTDLLDRARGALHAQPFSMLLGAELMHTGTSELTLSLPIRDELRQQHGFVHGGVISYLADNALTFAGAMSLGPKVVTGRACEGRLCGPASGHLPMQRVRDGRQPRKARRGRTGHGQPDRRKRRARTGGLSGRARFVTECG
jgi:acyl-coenzyme A thioesterase PaaI-like protein